MPVATFAVAAVVLAACGSGGSAAGPTTTRAPHPVLAESAGSVQRPPPAGTIAVPIETRQVAGGGETSSIVVVTISVGGGPAVPVQLDTGSSGLTILSSAVGPAAQSTGQAVQIP
jgi:hypothetical protein